MKTSEESMTFCAKHNQRYLSSLKTCPICFGEACVYDKEFCRQNRIKYMGNDESIISRPEPIQRIQRVERIQTPKRVVIERVPHE